MITENEETQRFLDFAVEACCEAGDIAMKYFRSDMEVVNKSHSTDYFDPVTPADKEIEAFLRHKINDLFPEHSIVGEEGGLTSGEASYTWYIDPIDGTRGFATGSPMWGILVGLMNGDDCVIGVMHQPFMQETYAGSKCGAFLLRENSRRGLQSSKVKHIADATMCCTHHLMFDSGQDMDIFHHLVNSCRFSRFGTDCYGYAQLSMGLMDFVFESNLATYDIIPLIPLVEGAGGVITDWQGGPVNQDGKVLASATPELHKEILDLIQSKSLLPKS